MNKKNKTAFHVRQGDVLIERIDKLPDSLKPVGRENGRVVLAHGDVTGHAHAIADQHVDLYASEQELGVTFIEVRDTKAELKHEEHATIQLSPGNYRVIRQREYSPEAIRNVAD